METKTIDFAHRCKWDTKHSLFASVDKARKLIGYELETDFKARLRVQ